MSEQQARPPRCKCGASPATRRWDGRPVCAGCHKQHLRESFAAAARRLREDRRFNEAMREMARDADAARAQ